ncbi:MAG TPA: ABC transporter substrate-binding protein [Candidatus Dormibacteraeota bacterium]|nr:ABC transporter substrate-binding protein [Candidatus Dormibacteraeota bacterium]
MRHIAWNWFVASSLLLGALALEAETRPRYGGTLHVTMRAALTSLDPADGSQPDSFARRSVTALLFDTLVSVDESGHVKPALAESWQLARGNQRRQFRLRHGIRFHDGTPLTGEAAASSLRAANPSWVVISEGDSVIIECDSPDPAPLAELALSRNAIVKRDADNKLIGTGAFHVVDWQPGKKLSLAAEEEHWSGRPFLEGIEIEMGRSFRDQMTALELGKAELVEVAPEQTHRVSQAGHSLTSSAPTELLALLFTREASSPEGKLLREALGLSVERGSIRNVLLQGAGQPAASLLPTWISGYGFVFKAEADLPRARQLRDQVRTIPAWTIGYDGSDPLARLLAERVALNAKDAGLSLQPSASASSDVRLVRIPLAASDPWITLQELAAQSGLPAMKSKSGPTEDLYAAEQAELATGRLIPLFHLPASYTSSSGLRNWALRIDGSWDVANAWLESAKP